MAEEPDDGIDINLIMGNEERALLSELRDSIRMFTESMAGAAGGSAARPGRSASYRPASNSRRNASHGGAAGGWAFSGSKTRPYSSGAGGEPPRSNDSKNASKPLSWSEYRRELYSNEETDFMNLSQVPGSRYTVSDILSQVGTYAKTRGFYIDRAGRPLDLKRGGPDPNVGEPIQDPEELRAALENEDPSVVRNSRFAKIAMAASGAGSISPYVTSGAMAATGGILGLRRMMSPNGMLFAPNKAAQGLGYGPSMNPLSQGAREQWEDVFTGMKDSWMGFNPYFSREDAMALRGNLNTMGYRGNSRDQMYSSATRIMKSTGLSAETTAQMLDRAYKTGTASIKGFEQAMMNLPAAARAARMSTEQMTKSINDMAASLSTSSGLGYGQAQQAYLSMSAAGITPEIQNALMNNEYLTQAGMTSSGMTPGEYYANPYARSAGSLREFESLLRGQGYGSLFDRVSTSNTNFSDRKRARDELRARLATDQELGGLIKQFGLTEDAVMQMALGDGGIGGIRSRESLAGSILTAQEDYSFAFDTVRRTNPELSDREQKEMAERLLAQDNPALSESVLKTTISEQLRATPNVDAKKIEEILKEDDLNKFLTDSYKILSDASASTSNEANERGQYLVGLKPDSISYLELARENAINNDQDPATRNHVGRLPGRQVGRSFRKQLPGRS